MCWSTHKCMSFSNGLSLKRRANKPCSDTTFSSAVDKVTAEMWSSKIPNFFFDNATRFLQSESNRDNIVLVTHRGSSRWCFSQLSSSFDPSRTLRWSRLFVPFLSFNLSAEVWEGLIFGNERTTAQNHPAQGKYGSCRQWFLFKAEIEDCFLFPPSSHRLQSFFFLQFFFLFCSLFCCCLIFFLPLLVSVLCFFCFSIQSTYINLMVIAVACFLVSWSQEYCARWVG